MLNEELQQMFKNRISDIKHILELHSEGKSSREISTKTRTAESYVIYVLKSGFDGIAEEVAKQYGLKLEDIPKEKSSLKKEEKKEPEYPESHEFICIDCAEPLIQIEDLIYESNTIRMYQCKKCKKVYPHTLDSQKYFGV